MALLFYTLSLAYTCLMRIAIVAPPFLNLPPTKQGGTENIIAVKVKELVRLGHHVTLFHAGRCDLPAQEKITIFPKAINDLPSDLASQESSRKLRLEMTYFAAVATHLVTDHERFDVIFNHTRGEVAFAPLTNLISTPIISIFHLPVLPENIDVLLANPKAYAISISDNQRGKWAKVPNFIATVYNGVDLEMFPMLSEPKRDFVFWIGTVGEHKNTLDAIIAAKTAGVKLIMAGKIRDKAYFEEKIEPEIDHKNIVYLGEIDYATKLGYFQNARAVLFPTRWPEPFGLIMIEALACGTPVIAYPNGAVPEVIADREVGFIVESPKAMAQAIRGIERIDRNSCRKLVENKFSSIVMVKNYLAAAAQVLRKLERKA